MAAKTSLQIPYPFFYFFFNDPSTTEIYTLSLHDALPISADQVADAGGGRAGAVRGGQHPARRRGAVRGARRGRQADRKSTRLNSSHVSISYAVFCLKKKKTN